MVRVWHDASVSELYKNETNYRLPVIAISKLLMVHHINSLMVQVQILKLSLLDLVQ